MEIYWKEEALTFTEQWMSLLHTQKPLYVCVLTDIHNNCLTFISQSQSSKLRGVKQTNPCLTLVQGKVRS